MPRGVLLDLGGVVYVGTTPVPGSIEAIARLRAAGLAVRFLTNTTRSSRRQLLAKLARVQLPVEAPELFMPAAAARQYIERERLQPYLLVHPDLREDFAGLATGERAAVVVGDAGERFDYAHLNRAFRLLGAGAEFLALATNRSFRDADGQLSLDAGPFVRALEYACRRQARILGKPSADFYRAALESMGCTPQTAVMVGDDVEADVGGAMAAGIPALLVRTGKYETGAETLLDPPPTAVLDDLPAAVDWILRRPCV